MAMNGGKVADNGCIPGNLSRGSKKSALNNPDTRVVQKTIGKILPWNYDGSVEIRLCSVSTESERLRG